MTASNSASIISNAEDETNGFVIVNEQDQTKKETIPSIEDNPSFNSNNKSEINTDSDFVAPTPTNTNDFVEQKKSEIVQNPEQATFIPLNSSHSVTKNAQVNLNLDEIYHENAQTSSSHNRGIKFENVLFFCWKCIRDLRFSFEKFSFLIALTHTNLKYEPDEEEQTNSYYDSSLGMVLNMDDNDRDTGEYKYQRRPLFEWLNRWLKY